MNGRLAAYWLRMMETVLVGMVFILPLAFFLRTYDSAMIKTTIFQLGAIALAASWILKGLERGRWEASQRVLPLLAPAAALLAWTLLVFALSPFKLAALPGFLNQVLSILTFCLILVEFGGADMAQRVMDGLLAAAWAACLYAVCQIAGFDPFVWAGAFGDRVFSTFANPDLFGLFLALCLPVALTRLLDPEASPLSRASNAALLPLLALSVVKTGSAEGVAAFAIQAVVYMVAAAAALPFRLAVRAMLAAGVLAVSVLATCGKPVEDNLVYESEFKRHTWAATLRLISEKPWLGHGPGSFLVHYPRFRPPEIILMEGKHNTETDHPESQVLETASELGWTGAALWFLVFGTVLAAALKARRLFERQGALREAVSTVGLAAAVAGMALGAHFGLGSQLLVPGWFLWALAGLLGGLTTLAQESPVVVLPIAFREKGRRALYGPVLALFLGAAVFPAVWFDSDIEHNLGIAFAEIGRFDEAAAHYDRVRPGAPAYLMAQYFKGNLLLDTGRPEEALKQYALLESLAPDYVQLAYQQGVAYAKTGDWENAIKSHERYAKTDPLFVPNYLRIAEAARASGNMARARKAALSAIALEPREPSHWKTLAQIYMKDRRLAAGRKMERQAARMAKLGGAPGDQR